MVRVDIIRRHLDRRPFQPFVMTLRDGEEERVPHPESVLLQPFAVVIVRSDVDWAWFHPKEVVKICSSRRNGRARRSRTEA